MSIAERLGVAPEVIEDVDDLSDGLLPPAEKLFESSFGLVKKVSTDESYGRAGPASVRTKEQLQEAQLLLAAAILDRAQKTNEGRLSGALSMIAQLVARADPEKTLGPEGAQLRHHLLPNGWISMTESWERTRYAWREGMEVLLDANATSEGRALVQALNEITRLHPAESDPVKVHIQETFPAPKVAFALTAIGLAFSARTFIKEVRSVKK